MTRKQNDLVTVTVPRWIADELGSLAWERSVAMKKAAARLGWTKIPGQNVLIRASDAAVEAMNDASEALYSAEATR